MKDRMKKLFRFIFIYYILGGFAILYVLYDIPDWGETLASIYFAISLFTFYWLFSELGGLMESYERKDILLEQYMNKQKEGANNEKN